MLERESTGLCKGNVKDFEEKRCLSWDAFRILTATTTKAVCLKTEKQLSILFVIFYL